MVGTRITISTWLSLSRVVLVIPFSLAILAQSPEGRMWAACVLAIGVLTDFLDGYLARGLHQVTEIGKIVDPLSDKISLGLAAVVLTWQGAVPWWYLILIVIRDLLILAGGIYIKKRKNVIVQSNWPGKVAVSLIALVLFISIFPDANHSLGFRIAFWASVFMMTLSLVLYTQRLFIGRNAIRTT